MSMLFHTKYALVGVTQGVRRAFSYSVQPSGVHEREKEQACSVGIPAHFARVLVPVIHARDMLPSESIVTGGSRKRVKDIVTKTRHTWLS